MFAISPSDYSNLPEDKKDSFSMTRIKNPVGDDIVYYEPVEMSFGHLFILIEDLVTDIEAAYAFLKSIF